MRNSEDVFLIWNKGQHEHAERISLVTLPLDTWSGV